MDAFQRELLRSFRPGELTLLPPAAGDGTVTGILRLRPVLITVGATVFALVPLALHGGPLWEPLSYAQIGGLAFATVVTLVLVRCSTRSRCSISRS